MNKLQNIKKTLSFLLLAVLLFSFMTFPASAGDDDGDGYDDETGEWVGEGSEPGGANAPSWSSLSQEEEEIEYRNGAIRTANLFADVLPELALQANLLHYLGIMTGENGKFEPEKKVTADDFISAAAKIINVEDSLVRQSLSNKLSEITKKPYNGSADISLGEAGALTVVILGYNVTKPQGYDLSLIAGENGLLHRMNARDYQVFSRESALKLIYNALNTGLLVIDKNINGELHYVGSDETPLSKYYKIYKRTGVVSANAETSLFERASSLKNDEVTIDGFIYKTGKTAVRFMLGQNIEFFYQYDADIDNDAVMVALLPKNNDVVKIPFELYVGTENKKVSYYESLRSSMVSNLIFNGNAIFNSKRVALSSFAPRRLEDRLSGMDSATFIDNNNDGSYDVVFITRSVTLAVKGVIEGSETLVTEIPYRANNTVYAGLKTDGNNNIVTILRDGREITFGSIKPGDVLTVTESRETGETSDSEADTVGVVTAIVSTQKISGEITEISAGDHSGDEYTINEKKYVLSRSYQSYIEENAGRAFILSEKGDFYLDNDGKIAFAVTDRKISQTFSPPRNVKDGTLSGAQYGYLFNIGISENLSRTAKIELLTMANKFQIFDVAEKMDITYYPLYAPYAIYDNSGSDAEPAGAYGILSSSYYGYIDPVVMRRFQMSNGGNVPFASVFHTLYPTISNLYDVSMAQYEYFQQGYGVKESGRAGDILNKYFNANIDSRGNIKGGFVFDLEKISLIRFVLDNEGKIKELEMAKDYGIPYQWGFQSEAGRISSETRKEDALKDVFRLSTKAYQTRETTGSYSYYSVAYRYNAASRTFFENAAIDDAGIPSALNTDAQNPLFYLKENAYIFVAPVVNTVVNYYFDSIQGFTLEKLNRMRQERFRYRVVRFNPKTNGNYVVSAYNLDETNSTNLMVRHLTLNNITDANIRVVVDKVTTVLDEYGNAVQKLMGYNLADGKQVEYISNAEGVYQRKSNVLGAPEVFSGTYKRGDIILTGKLWQETGYAMSEPRFVYDSPLKYRFNNYLAGDIMSPVSLDTRNPHGIFMTVPTPSPAPKGVRNAVTKYREDFDRDLGYYFLNGTSENLMKNGEFAGRISDISLPYLKMTFREEKMNTGNFSREDTKFTRFISPGVNVFEVTDSAVNPITIYDISANDFIVGYVFNNAVTQIVRYNNVK